MTYLDRWYEGKPPILVMVVSNMVCEFDETHQTLSQIRTGNPMEFEVPVSAKLWRKFYWSNNRLMRPISGLQTCFINQGEKQKSIVELPQDEIQAAIHNQFGENPNFREILGQIILKLAQSDKSLERTAAYGMLAWMTFLWRVGMPGWLHYQKTPFELYRAAKNGDDQAMDQLLRVDKSAVTIPAIGRRWHEIMTGGNASRRQFMLKAIEGKPGRNLQPARVKMSSCGIIQIFGEAFGEPLSTADMRQLLDMIEKDRTGKSISIDTSIPDDNESLAQALRREREQWMSVIRPKKPSPAI